MNTPKFIKLTFTYKSKKETCYLNVSHIVSMIGANMNTEIGTAACTYYVEETPEQIMALIEETQK